MNANNSSSPSERGAKGFTLAETLITLVIIGIVAALTVPSLMNKTNNQEYVSKLKKAYSTLSQATNMIIAEEGTPRADKGGWATDSQAIYDIYRKKLNNTKECNITIRDEDHIPACFDQLKNNGTYKILSGNGNWRPTSPVLKSFIMADGTQVLVEQIVNSNCSSYCALFRIDINGAKKPNILGRDLFEFLLTEKGFYPSHFNHQGNVLNICSKNNHGWGCATRVLREGAMNY